MVFGVGFFGVLDCYDPLVKKRVLSMFGSFAAQTGPNGQNEFLRRIRRRSKATSNRARVELERSGRKSWLASDTPWTPRKSCSERDAKYRKFPRRSFRSATFENDRRGGGNPPKRETRLNLKVTLGVLP